MTRHCLAQTCRLIAMGVAASCLLIVGACSSEDVGSSEINDGENQSQSTDNQSAADTGTDTNGGGFVDADSGSDADSADNQDDPDAGEQDDVAQSDDAGPATDSGSSDDVDQDLSDADAGPTTGCDANPDCDADEICVRDAPGEQGQCQPPIDERLAGDDCDDSAQCATGLCFQGWCTDECADTGDCPDGWGCDDLGQGHVCVPPACASDENCGDDQVCAFSTAGPGDDLETLCLLDNDGGEAGDICFEDGDCAARLCRDDRCSPPCTDDDQCSDIQLCNEDTVALGGAQGVFDICTEFGLMDCDSALDCEPESLTCNRLPPTTDMPACGLRNPGGAEVGESCSVSGDCGSDICWIADDGSTGECSIFCEEGDRDCAGHQVCDVNDEVGMCHRGCGHNGDCVGGNICQMGIDGDDQFHGYCEHTVGDKDTGEACDDALECITGQCLTMTTYQISDTDCDIDAHCDAGYQCACPPGQTSCTANDTVCISEDTTTEQRCSELCDSDTVCESGTHEMSECADNITVTMDGVTGTVSACVMPLQQ